MGAIAGQGEGAFAVVNLNGRPATKAEVTSEVREVARLTGTTGHVTGHSMRVTGAQRLALAGISEVRISTFGRWASRAFQLYVRESVLGANGGDMALVVEENAAATDAIWHEANQQSQCTNCAPHLGEQEGRPCHHLAGRI